VATFDKFQHVLNNLVSTISLLDYFAVYLTSVVNFVTVAERSQWLRSCWQIGFHCACIRILKRTLTSRCSCCTKQLNTRPRKDQLMLWRLRLDTRCQRIGCYERKPSVEHWSANLDNSILLQRIKQMTSLFFLTLQ